MAGLMGVTGFLSMWINNSAAASIMLPVALAIADELENHGKTSHEKKIQAKEETAAVNGKPMISYSKTESCILLLIEVIEMNNKDFVNDNANLGASVDQLHIEEPFVLRKSLFI